MKKSKATQEITIAAPNFQVFVTTIVGTAPYVSNNFSQEARDQMAADQAAGQKAKASRGAKAPKDFEAGYRGSLHQVEDGTWYGIPATAIKAALVRACAVSGMEMTKAKMCIFVLQDGFEKSGTPLIRITKGKPERFDSYVRNSNGSPDIRARAKFAQGWECQLRIRFDADMLGIEHIANLVSRAGISVGVGAGRPFSSMSCGMGWGTFEIRDQRVEAVAGSSRKSKSANGTKEANLS